MGVDKTLATIEDAKTCALKVMELAKNGFSLRSLPEIVSILFVGAALARDARDALPELKELDSEEVGKVSAKAYECVREVILAASK